MKETKVYIDELPESCINCPCCSCDLKPELNKTWKATEENFYKAYDECERLFKGRSDINEVEK